jgi:hypothetical protein
VEEGGKVTRRNRIRIPGQHAPKNTGRGVWFFMPAEKAIHHLAHDAAMNVAALAAVGGAQRISMGPTRVDIARNRAARKFMEVSRRPKDTFIMLDADHEHPRTVIDILVAHDKGVVGALCFRRTSPFDPQVYIRDEEGELLQPATWGSQLLKSTIVGTGAISIQRWVFEKLEAEGFRYPWFRMMYEDGEDSFLGEDWYFGTICEKAGIEQWCDMGFVSPHIANRLVTKADYDQWRAEHAAELGEPAPLEEKREDWLDR